jgi:hypothetical protein
MNDLDRLIDGALSNYAPEPAPGLEQRVLGRIHRTWPWVPFAGIAAVAAAMVALVSMPEPEPLPPPPPFIANVAPVPVVALVVVAPVVRPRAAQSIGIPLSTQERRLEKFMQTYPELAQQLATDSAKESGQPAGVSPLELQPISIEPLETIAPSVD